VRGKGKGRIGEGGHRDVVFRCLKFLVGLREVPEIVREGISLTGFPLVYESNPIEAILFYYTVSSAIFIYFI
jgi:hypothetical protein